MEKILCYSTDHEYIGPLPQNKSPPVIFIQCHPNSTRDANRETHQKCSCHVASIVSSYNSHLNCTFHYLLCSTRTKSHHPANTAAIFPSSVASLERRLDKLTSTSSLAFNASCFACRISRLTSYSRRCFLSHLEAECLASRSCASEVGRVVAVAPSKGVEEVCGSCLAV